MSLDDIKAIDWAHPNPTVWPQYIQISLGLVVLGIILIVIGLFL